MSEPLKPIEMEWNQYQEGISRDGRIMTTRDFLLARRSFYAGAWAVARTVGSANASVVRPVKLLNEVTKEARDEIEKFLKADERE